MAARKSAKQSVKKAAKKSVKKAVKKSATKAGARKTTARNGVTTERTSSQRAGRPVDAETAQPRSRSALEATPSQADLDIRDRLKSGQRRPAGPPLVGDIMTRAAMDGLRDEKPVKPTDPTPATGSD